MAHPEPSLDQARLRETLVTVLDQATPACTHVEYRLVGTGAALLHGVEVPTADVDILVRRREDVDAFGVALSSFRCLSAPAWLPETKQYYGNYDVHGVEVEFSTVEIESEADIMETFGRGPWDRFVPIPCGPHTVPTVALELRLITELLRDRPDRSWPILRYMQVHGCDIDFVQRGMEAMGLAQDVREDVLNQLEASQDGEVQKPRPHY